MHTFRATEELALERIKTGIELIDYETAIRNTPEIEILQSVLDNLRFLKKSQNYMDGLDEVITRK